MTQASEYIPPKVWTWDKENSGQFANINRPISGATHDKALAVGKHPLQLYSTGTPNGQKVTIMLEELLALGHSGAEYDAWLIRIGDDDQFSSGFVEINPSSKVRIVTLEEHFTVRELRRQLSPEAVAARGYFSADKPYGPADPGEKMYNLGEGRLRGYGSSRRHRTGAVL